MKQQHNKIMKKLVSFVDGISFRRKILRAFYLLSSSICADSRARIPIKIGKLEANVLTLQLLFSFFFI